MLKQIKIIVEKHPEGYVAYPVGLKGVVVAEGDSYEEALAEVKSAIEFHVETFGREVLQEEEMAQEVFVAESDAGPLPDASNAQPTNQCPEEPKAEQRIDHKYRDGAGANEVDPGSRLKAFPSVSGEGETTYYCVTRNWIHDSDARDSA